LEPGGPRPRIVEPACAVFRRRLREGGLKYTPERARVLDVISSLPGPFEVERVIAALAEAGGPGPRVSKATVYRTIHLLVSAGVLRPVRLEGGQEHYELEWGESGSVVVVRRGVATSVTPGTPALAQAVRAVCAALGVSPTGHRLVIYAADAKPDSKPHAKADAKPVS
jgi:Fur family ferric uptake transcriptional regulator